VGATLRACAGGASGSRPRWRASCLKADPDRARPHRAPLLNIIAPFSFVVSGFIIYWSGTANVVKRDATVVFFLILYVIARRLGPNQEPLNFRAGA
jgi:hypothetical protein